ncbi:COR domain-containing protein [Streptomyces nymphaeiformis]|uniref:non-specific serine/threonine protein kinase n=1 Tax=Streptomyces nymphaeiformis TaxID=2663842 RepID=A0A7W7TY01_9ACTN|nr:COR domain-containing protein [Streptomyces nymphaeiformis]MBB4981459.1 GTPase SAR1 family protein [Streptomyces nymphaeiformis]
MTAEQDPIKYAVEQARDTGTLALSGLGLTRIPDETWDRGNLSGVHTLDLTNNRLEDLNGAPIDQLPNLKKIMLDRNRLRFFPHGLDISASLEYLSLDGNGIRSLEIPEVHLPCLTTLTVAKNGLEEVSSTIGELSNLKYLDLSDNLLGSLPQNIAELQQLRELKLGGNPGFVPPGRITALRSLRHLDISNNHLTELPVELGGLPNEITLRLNGNFFNETIELLAKRQTSHLLAYLRSLDAEPYREAKLILVGEGNIGKTSMIEALRGNPFVEGRPTTHGIEIHTFKVRDEHSEEKEEEEGEEVTIRSWDFGGQEVYRITHQFFFSKGALYLVVWRPREGQEANFVEDWLKRIKIRCGENARVLLVSTYADEGRSPEIDYSQLRRKYGDILAGSLAIDSKSGKGIRELKTKLAVMAHTLPRMGERISRRWLDVQEELLRSDSPYVKRATFDRICDRHNVDELEAEAIAPLLNDLGYIVYYPDDQELRDILILQPEWLTKAISCVFEDPETRQNQGILSHASLARIWGGGEIGYDEKLHPYFLRLMEKFDVSYRIPEEDASLIAQLVPYVKPEFTWPDSGPELSLYCDFAHRPTGLIPWMTVRTRRFSSKQWRQGFLLTHPEYDAKALVELLSPTRLSIRAVGGSHYFIFSVLRDTLQHLIRIRWPGLAYRIRVPCLTYSDHIGQCEGSFPIENLEKLRSDGTLELVCTECLAENDVNQLLLGFPAAKQLQQEFAMVESLRLLHGEVASIDQVLRAMLLFMKATNVEVTDCPTLFTLSRVESKAYDARKLWKEGHLLQLWCEEPGSQHPIGEPYSLGVTKEWVADIAPYLRFTAKAVSVLAPIAGNLGGLLDAQDLKDSSLLMKALADAAAPLKISEAAEEADDQLSPAEGAALRRFREMLFKLDSSRDFRGLRRVYLPTGQYVWLCETHYRVYEPSLLQLPEPQKSIDGSVEPSP